MPNPHSKREEQLKRLPTRILQVLKKDGLKLRLEDLRKALPEFGDLPDEDWYGVINDLLSDSLVDARVLRSGIHNAIGAAFKIEITSRGRALTPELAIQTQPIPLKEGEPRRLVTLRGECFEITFQRREVAQDRDGVFYLFHLEDLSNKKRGKRLVSVYRFGPKDFYAPNYDVRLDTVLLNTIRRAFDSGALDFNAAYDEHRYKEIALQAEDFNSQPPTNGNDVQQLIKHEAYWLAFRYNEKPGTYALQFDSPTDLEYLGITAAEVHRYVWLLGRRGLLDQITDGIAKPTDKLIDAYESELSSKSIGANVKAPAEPVLVQQRKPLAAKFLPEPAHTPGEGLTGGRPPRVFVSYSWDTSDHKQWVLDFATRLRKEGGVEIILDQWHLRPGGDKTIFMEKNIRESDFVIVVCTPGYATRANARTGGVGYEAMIITGALAEEINQEKFIPILRSGDWKSSLPSWLKTRIGIDFSNDPPTEDEYQKLLRALHREPVEPPPIGPKPKWQSLATAPPQEQKRGPTQAKPKQNAIAFARYETTGENAVKAEAYVRPSNDSDGWFTFENSFGEEEHGTMEAIAMRFAAFDKSLTIKGYIRKNWANNSGKQAFNL